MSMNSLPPFPQKKLNFTFTISALYVLSTAKIQLHQHLTASDRRSKSAQAPETGRGSVSGGTKPPSTLAWGLPVVVSVMRGGADDAMAEER
mmetsp:Transcript_23868/g.51037  ORF Transcript_23868/g.51037 Transcript_23868/m.51037 type:complete len:91 (-) Transcript_23868:368-640(-)